MFGQVRSVSTIGTNGAYFSKGIGVGVTFWGGIGFSCVFGIGDVEGLKKQEPPDQMAGGAGERECAALALREQKEAVAQHRS